MRPVKHKIYTDSDFPDYVFINTGKGTFVYRNIHTSEMRSRKINHYYLIDKQGPKKWYASQVTTEQMDETAVSEAIADETTLNPGEAMMAIRQLRKVILAALHNGKSVKLGNWGSFYAVAESDPADTAEALTAKNVKRVKINFRPGKEIKESLAKATFVWVVDMAGVDTTEEEDGGTPGEV